MASRIRNSIVAAVERGETMTCHELAEKCPCATSAAHKMLHRMHKAGELSIVSWVRRTGCPLPVFGAYRGKDAPKPRPLTNAEHKRIRYANPELRALMLAKKKLRRERGKRVDLNMVTLLGL